MSFPEINQNPPSPSLVGTNQKLWESKRFAGKRDLAIKKFAICLLAAANLAALGALFFYVSHRFPWSTKPLLISPFIMGALGGLIYLKLPTLGLTPYNYTEHSNPAVIVARVVTMAFFAPVIIVRNYVDGTNYASSLTAKKIRKDFERVNKDTEKFDIYKFTCIYKSNLPNLVHYGYLTKEESEELKTFFSKIYPTVMKIRSLKEAGVKAKDLKDRLNDETEEEWKGLQSKLLLALPNPDTDKIDFTKRSTRFRIKASEYLPFLTI